MLGVVYVFSCLKIKTRRHPVDVVWIRTLRVLILKRTSRATLTYRVCFLAAVQLPPLLGRAAAGLHLRSSCVRECVGVGTSIIDY